MAIPAILASVAGGILSAVAQSAMGSTGATSTATSSSQTLDKDAFLRLLTTQLRNQDPLNPMDNSEFVAQTAQFSSLEQLQNMNKALERLATASGSGGVSSAAALLGRTVTVNGSMLTLESGKSATLSYGLPAQAAAAVVRVTDASGSAVRTLYVGQQGKGTHQVVFDGLDDSGRSLAAGSYGYQVTAVNSAGQTLPGVTTGGGQVTGISVENGSLVLLLGEQRVPSSAVVGVLSGS
jgi:flagellar basal-body rod modification protein FlgD